MKYLDIKDFDERYQFRNKESLYDKIFITDTYVIKKHKRFNDFVRELCIYNTFKHPCIMNIEDYSYDSDNNEYYYSMIRGKHIRDALKENLISMRDFISDILSAILFLHANAIGHFDIKEDNIIFIDGKAKLIDFELSERCYLCECSNLYYNVNSLQTTDVEGVYDYYTFNNIGFTEYYRDPQFSHKSYNSIKSDLYAFALTIYDLSVYDNIDRLNKMRGVYMPSLSKIDDDIRDFISLCILPWRLRPHFELLNHKVITRRYDIHNIPYISISNNKHHISMIELLDFLKMSVEESMFALNLHKTVYSSLLTEDNIDLFNISCVLITSQLFNNDLSISDIKDFDIRDITDMCFDILEYIRFNMNIINIFDYTRYDNISDVYSALCDNKMITLRDYNYDILHLEPLKIRAMEYDVLLIKDSKDITLYKTLYKIPDISIKRYDDVLNALMYIKPKHDSKHKIMNIILLHSHHISKVKRKTYNKFKKEMKKNRLRKQIMKTLLNTSNISDD